MKKKLYCYYGVIEDDLKIAIPLRGNTSEYQVYSFNGSNEKAYLKLDIHTKFNSVTKKFDKNTKGNQIDKHKFNSIALKNPDTMKIESTMLMMGTYGDKMLVFAAHTSRDGFTPVNNCFELTHMFEEYRDDIWTTKKIIREYQSNRI